MSPAYRTRQRVMTMLPNPVTQFLRTEAAGGVALMIAAALALLWANGPLGDSYTDLWSTDLSVSLQSIHLDLSLQEWVNTGLMTVFFFVVGLEIKRELVTGDLSDVRTAMVPIIAAAGGMITPAAIYLAFNAGTPTVDGWGIPVATDIAFALGVLALLGSRVPRPLKLFLLTLAIADDIGGIVVIALFYTTDLAPEWLLGALAALAAVAILQRFGARHPALYVLPGAVLWLSLHEAGIEAAIAGVILGLITPARPFRGDFVIPGLERAFLPWSSFLIVPLFALANTGVVVTAETLGDAVQSRVFWGVLCGLVVGKAVGVSVTTWLSVKFKVGTLPAGVSWRQMIGVAALAGIGFTVALFIAELSLEGTPLADAKMAILGASCLAAILGALILRGAKSPAQLAHQHDARAGHTSGHG